MLKAKAITTKIVLLQMLPPPRFFSPPPTTRPFFQNAGFSKKMYVVGGSQTFFQGKFF